MEPVRGGKLAKLDEINETKLKELRPDESIPAWAFRFLQTALDCTVVLSGMSDFAQVQENIRTFQEEKPLNAQEMQALQDIVDELMGKLTPCTGCRYCTEYCPQGLNIPTLLNMYNEYKFSFGGIQAQRSILRVPEGKRPADCVQCRACEGVCPQKIRIADELANFQGLLQ